MFKKLAAQSAGIGTAATMLAARAHAAVPAELNNGVNSANPGGASSVESVFKNVANTLIFIVGAVAVIMLIVGGLRYVLSGGNKESVEGAKNTILYALIGVIVAIMAYAAVRFVLTRFGN